MLQHALPVLDFAVREINSVERRIGHTARGIRA
jgi:hypothetical protein